MNSSYQKSVLGSEAKTYIRQRLSAGNTLTKLLLERLNGREGEVAVAFPLGIQLNDLDKFKDGGKIPADESKAVYKNFWGRPYKMVPTPTFRTFLIDTIESFLKKDAENICVFEDNLIKPSDPWFQPFRKQFFFYGDEVYHFVRGCDVTTKDAEAALKLTRSWLPAAGILTDLNNLETDFLSTGAIDLATLKTLAGHAHKIFVEAYDHESFLVWDLKPAS
jgi:hypothetical protein